MSREDQRDIGCVVLIGLFCLSAALIGMLGWAGVAIIGVIALAIAILMMVAVR
jgi:hypothetical protein